MKKIILFNIIALIIVSISYTQSYEMWSWGRNEEGQLGYGNNVDKNVPTRVAKAIDWAEVASGNLHNIGLKKDGTMWSWGLNDYGQLGLTSNISKNNPVKVGADNDWQNIFCGYFQSFGIKKDGTLWGWGDNSYGQLGVGNKNSILTPLQAGTDNNWKSISAGAGHVLALKNDGSIWACGYNLFYQLGIGITDNSLNPVQIGTDNDWKLISTGRNHSFAIKNDGSLWVWGWNDLYGQLGDGTSENKKIPTKIGTDLNWGYITGGLGHSVALKYNLASVDDNKIINNISTSPNPVSDNFNIEFNSEMGKNVKINLYSITGIYLKTLFDGEANIGINKYSFDFTKVNLTSGVYSIQLESGGLTQSKQIEVVR